ncbi:MAG: tetratricopeptide repeat protein [Candidatus Eiseniibacteriota bacterium]
MSGRPAIVALLGVAVLSAGCGDSQLIRLRYQTERAYWSASREEVATRMVVERPDSLSLLAVRDAYRSVGEGVDLAGLKARTASQQSLRRDVKHVMGSASLDAGRVALDANRIDLALQDGDRTWALADEDSILRKTADFFKVDALRRTRRDEEALDAMQRILDQYEPVIPEGGLVEDPVLALPEAIVAIREQMGDGEGAQRAIQSAKAYYRTQLERPWPPEGEAGIRARLVRLELEDRDWDDALSDLRRLQALAQSTPSLSLHEAEIHYFEATIKAKGLEGSNPLAAVALLDAVVIDYPKSPFAARAAHDAGLMLEAHGRKKDALDRYRIISERFGDNADVAPDAAYRRALLADQLGDWVAAKNLLETIPIRYPESQAALDAPMAIVRHYRTSGEPAAVQTALRKAASTYQGLIANRPTSSYRGGYRWALSQAQFQLGRWDDGLLTIDRMAAEDTGHPLTSQGLLDASKVAETHGQRARAAGYLRRYLALHPDPSRVADVQRDLDRLQ